MKKIKYLLMILVICLLTGCVKFNVNMDIKNDKSMKFSMIYAVNKTLLGDQKLLDDADKKKIEEQGFTLEDYDKDDMKGYVLSKNIKNIDEVSTEKDTEYSLSGVLDNNSSDSYFFKVTKGLLKNTYKANFNFNASDSGLNNDLTSGDLSTEGADDNKNEADKDTSTDNKDQDSNLDLGGDLDFSSLASTMDLSFNVTLPNAAKSNNATSTDNGLKTLSWKLDSSGMDSIEFEFELYNMTTIYVGIGVVALFIILIIVIILCMKKGKDNKETKDTKDTNQAPSNQVKEEEKNEVKTEDTNNQTVAPTNVELPKESVSAPQLPSQTDAKEEVKTASPLESINIVPLAPPESLETPSITPPVVNEPVAPITPTTTPAGPVAPENPFTPQIIPTVAQESVEVKNESALDKPSIGTSTTNETVAPNQTNQQEQKPKIEQLEDF